MDLYNIISTALTLFRGGGWFVYYRANKRKANGEATVAEAEGWLKQQEAYHNTIAELKTTCEYIANDRNLLREENSKLREENNALRDKINDMDNQIFELKKEVSRLGRRLEALSTIEREERKKKSAQHKKKPTDGNAKN